MEALDEVPSVVARAVLDKHYAKPGERFVLLVYSLDTLRMSDHPDLVEACRLLADRTHPFDEVWYLYPYAEKDLGHLVPLFPVI